MSEKDFGAFISYRRGGNDEAVARVLHRMLETYRTPRRLVKEGFPSRIGHVFLDTAEREASSSLDETIRSALDRSNWLVVVCSPRTPRSTWVPKEVSHFAAGRPDRLLVLLIDGDPEHSYPSILRATGDPKAADIRAANLRDSLRTLRKTEMLALLAPMLGCRYDDLKARELQRKRTRRASWSLAVLLLIVTLGALGIRIQSETIRNELNGLLQNFQTAIDQGDDLEAARLALKAWYHNQRHGLDAEHEVERQIRDGFTKPVFRRILHRLDGDQFVVDLSRHAHRLAVTTSNGDLFELQIGKPEIENLFHDMAGLHVTTTEYLPGTANLYAGSNNGIIVPVTDGASSAVNIGFARVSDIAATSSGNTLFVAAENGVNVLDLSAASQEPVPLVQGFPVNSVALDGEDSWLAYPAGNRLVLRRAPFVSGGAEEVTLTLPQSMEVTHIAFETDSRRLLAAAYALSISEGLFAKVFLWEDFLETTGPTEIFANNDMSLRAEFVGRGEILLHGESTNFRFLATPQNLSDSISNITPSIVAAASSSDSVVTFDRQSRELIELDFQHGGFAPVKLEGSRPVRDLVFAGSTAETLAVAYQGQATPDFWNLGGVVPTVHQPLAVDEFWGLSGESINNLAVSVTPPGYLFAARNRVLEDEVNLAIWNLDRLEMIDHAFGHSGNANDLDLSDDGRILVSVGNIESSIMVMDFQKESATEFELGQVSELMSVTVAGNTDQFRVAACDQQGTVLLVDFPDGKIRRQTQGIPGGPGICVVHFVDNGKWLVASGPKGVRLFNPQDGTAHADLHPQTAILSLDSSQHGASLFAGALDGRVLRWNLQNLDREAFALKPPGPAATAVSVSADDRFLASGFADGSVFIWPRRPGLLNYLSRMGANPH